LDQTAANDTEDKHFNPYLPLADTGKALYFGFDQEFEGGPVRLYFAAKELEVDERNKPKVIWEFAFDNDWKSLLARDGTDAFTKPEFVSLLVPEGFQNTQQFGRALYWLRATLAGGSWKDSPLFQGVFVNTVAALQARTIRNEILGSSTGIKNQKFRFQQVPVIEREEVRVLEVLTDNEREQLLAERGADAVLTITDQRGKVLQTWVRWTEVMEFFDSDRTSRNYRLDRATGEIEFGDGVHGRIPPAGGDNIQAFAYQRGGGASGNVAPGEITSAVTAVAGVDSVINPVAGGGGSEAATNNDMLEIGPAQISNRGRAVTPEDFERLAQEASREVRKALCLPNRNVGGHHELGWTSVHIVPDSKDAEPRPSLELRRAVQRYLAQRADVTLVDQNHIFVGPPKYVPVSVEVTIFAKSLDVIALAEQSVRQKLDQFLHPLTGGPANQGWDFGRDLAASDLYALLEDIEDVDHVARLRLRFAETESEERVEVGADALIASGTHKIEMNVVTENM
jgi:predicted phage baseplate assembly protein